MTRIPLPALILGLSGLIPFLWGALTVVSADLATWSEANLGARFTARTVLQTYGIVILAFMSGVIWGFATRASGAMAATGYFCSVIPALWAFFLATGNTTPALWALLAGFISLLALDLVFVRAGVAPGWWMSLRLLLTTVVSACLLIGALS